MKNIWLYKVKWLTAVAFKVTTILICWTSAYVSVGCRHDEQAFAKAGGAALQNADTTLVEIPEDQRNEAVVIYGMQPSHFSFRVGNEIIGTNNHRLVEYLKAASVTDVRFSSEYKLTHDDANEFVTLFNSAGIRVRYEIQRKTLRHQRSLRIDASGLVYWALEFRPPACS